MESSEAPVCRWQGKYLRVVSCGHWEYVERPEIAGAIVVAALTPAGRLLLIEQYRIPMRARVIELPAGLVGDEPGQTREDLVGAAKRELIEETGYEAVEMQELASGPPSAGLATEVVTFYMARKLRRVSQGGGTKGESIIVHEVAVGDVVQWLEKQRQKGLLIDPKIFVALYFLQRDGAK